MAPMKSQRDVPCPECGAPLGGRDGCRKRFHTLSIRAASDAANAPLHRLAVDAYALQHPDEYCLSAKSLAAHLTGVCAAIEREPETEEINDGVQRWLSGNPSLGRPTPPTSRGSFTIADLGEDRANVRVWAASAWGRGPSTASWLAPGSKRRSGGVDERPYRFPSAILAFRSLRTSGAGRRSSK
jgi:hypothetical protein